jgi:ribosomal protein L40E
MGAVPQKRPKQIYNLATAWVLFGFWNLYSAVRGITGKFENWDMFSSPLLPLWLRLAIPAELCICIAILVAVIIQLITVPLLLIGKPSSIKLALGAFISVAVLNLVLAVLYVTAPPEFLPELSPNIVSLIGMGIVQFLVVFYFWRDLNEPEVKLFLGSIEAQKTAQERTGVQTAVAETKSKQEFYCRYCGAENKTDAVFCEKCGRQLRET